MGGAPIVLKPYEERIAADMPASPTGAAILAERRSNSLHLPHVGAMCTVRRGGPLRCQPIHLSKTVSGLHGFLLHVGSPPTINGFYVSCTFPSSHAKVTASVNKTVARKRRSLVIICKYHRAEEIVEQNPLRLVTAHAGCDTGSCRCHAGSARRWCGKSGHDWWQPVY